MIIVIVPMWTAVALRFRNAAHARSLALRRRPRRRSPSGANEVIAHVPSTFVARRRRCLRAIAQPSAPPAPARHRWLAQCADRTSLGIATGEVHPLVDAGRVAPKHALHMTDAFHDWCPVERRLRDEDW